MEPAEKQGAGFNAILERYKMPKEANWKPLVDWIALAQYNLPQNSGKGESVMDIDAEELIRLIFLLDKGGEIKVHREGSVDVCLKDGALLKYLLLSLHKLVQLKWGMQEASDDEKKAGAIELFTMGNKGFVKVGVKGVQEKVGAFINPYSDEELDALLSMVKAWKNYEKIKAGRGKNVAFLGDKVVEVWHSIPEEARKNRSKTDLLNFVGEVMGLTEFMEFAPRWGALSEELAEVESHPYYSGAGDIRKQRRKMLEDWVKSAKKAYEKANRMALGEQCEELIKSDLKFYDELINFEK